MTGFTSWRLGAPALLAAAMLWSGAARAQPQANVDEFKRTAAQIIGPVSIVDALAVQCDAPPEKGRDSRKAAIEAWRAANRIDEFQAAMMPLYSRAPNGAVLLAALREKAAEEARKLHQKNPGICEKFDELLADKALALGGQVNDILPPLTIANARLAAGTPPPPRPSSTTDLTLYTVSQLSNLAEMAMNPIASAEAAGASREHPHPGSIPQRRHYLPDEQMLASLCARQVVGPEDVLLAARLRDC